LGKKTNHVVYERRYERGGFYVSNERCVHIHVGCVHINVGCVLLSVFIAKGITQDPLEDYREHSWNSQ